MWVRPTPRIYAYNREISSSSASAASAEAQSSRSLRASSEVAESRGTTTSYSASSTRAARASSLAPEPGTGLAGYTGFYGRRLALLKETEAARAAESALTAAASSAAASRSSAVAAASSSSSAASMAARASSVQRSTEETTVKTTVQRSMSVQQEQSIKEGRQSMSRAVRRAEQHAETSGRDPRHVGVPWDITDDICKKVADIHMSPFDGREISAAKAALSQGQLKIDRMERELAAITESAMKYKSIYAKSAHQLAKEAMEAAESEARSSKKVRKTVVEETRRGVAVA